MLELVQELPVSRSQSRTVPSSPQDTARRPSGRKATDHDVPDVPEERVDQSRRRERLGGLPIDGDDLLAPACDRDQFVPDGFAVAGRAQAVAPRPQPDFSRTGPGDHDPPFPLDRDLDVRDRPRRSRALRRA